MKTYLRIFGVSLLSSFLIYIGSQDTILVYLIQGNILSEHIHIKEWQTISFLMGIVWAGGWLPLEYALLKVTKKKKDKQFINVLNFYKEHYFQILKNEIGAERIKFKTHIYKPRGGIWGVWNKYINKRVLLEMVYVKGISDRAHHNALHFEVHKNISQGMVGKCYLTRKIWLDVNIEENNYNLTEEQLSKVSNVGFCSTIPIFNAEQNKIVAIISVG